jgi:hypothetical protein
LPLGVRTNRIGLDAELGLHERVDDIDSFPDAGRNKVAEHRDIGIGHVAVGDRAHLPVAEVIARQQIVFEEIKLRSISPHHRAAAPGFRQIHFEIELDELPACGVQLLRRDVFAVGE